MTEEDLQVAQAAVAAQAVEITELRATVADQKATIAALMELYEKKVREADEDGTRKKLAAIHAQIAEAVSTFEERMRASLKAARQWGDEHNVVGRGEMLDIIERALPRR